MEVNSPNYATPHDEFARPAQQFSEMARRKNRDFCNRKQEFKPASQISTPAAPRIYDQRSQNEPLQNYLSVLNPEL